MTPSVVVNLLARHTVQVNPDQCVLPLNPEWMR
jgi:hypothetical protein